LPAPLEAERLATRRRSGHVWRAPNQAFEKETTMGLFSFIKEAGAKLFGGGSAQAATADALKKEVQGHGLDAERAVDIKLDGDKAKLSGQVKTQEELEKIILSVGNTVGVAQVDTSELKVQTPSAEAKMYTVKKGDTLWEIAEKH
jgi:nucleoid-associated protein YgaU